MEVQATSIELVGDVDDPDTYPISAKRHSLSPWRSFFTVRPFFGLYTLLSTVCP